jgi:hypothetical protein
MPRPVKERIAKLREEIAQISEANREYLQGGKKPPGAPDQERRLLVARPSAGQRQRSTTAWEETCRNTSADGTATSFSSVTVTRMLWDGVEPGGSVEFWARETWTRSTQTAKQIADVCSRCALGTDDFSIFSQGQLLTT